jgi:hypothetical protein
VAGAFFLPGLLVVLEDVRFLYGVFVVKLWWIRGELWSVDDPFEIFLQLFRFRRFTVLTHDVANCVSGKENDRASHDAHISKSRYGAPGTLFWTK